MLHLGSFFNFFLHTSYTKVLMYVYTADLFLHQTILIETKIFQLN